MTNGTHTSPEEHVPPTDYRGQGWLFWLHRLPRTISKPEDARELCEVMMRTGAGVAGDPHFLSEALQFWIRAQPPSLRIREEEVWARVVVERYPLAWKALAKWLGDTESGAAGEATVPAPAALNPITDCHRIWREVEVPLADIKLDPSRLHSVDHGVVAVLAASIRLVGQIHPVLLSTDCRLVSGYHRFAALKALGFEIIRGFVYHVDDTNLRQLDIEENYARRELTKPERTKLHERRWDLLQQTHHEVLRAAEAAAEERKKEEAKGRRKAAAAARLRKPEMRKGVAQGEPRGVEEPDAATAFMKGRVRDLVSELYAILETQPRATAEALLQRLEDEVVAPTGSTSESSNPRPDHQPQGDNHQEI